MDVDEKLKKRKKKTNSMLKKRSEIEKQIKDLEQQLYEKQDKSRLFFHDEMTDEEIQKDIIVEIPRLPYSRPEIWRELGILIRQNELIRRQNEIIISELKKFNRK